MFGMLRPHCSHIALQQAFLTSHLKLPIIKAKSNFQNLIDYMIYRISTFSQLRLLLATVACGCDIEVPIVSCEMSIKSLGCHSVVIYVLIVVGIYCSCCGHCIVG